MSCFSCCKSRNLEFTSESLSRRSCADSRFKLLVLLYILVQYSSKCDLRISSFSSGVSAFSISFSNSSLFTIGKGCFPGAVGLNNTDNNSTPKSPDTGEAPQPPKEFVSNSLCTLITSSLSLGV